MLGFIGLLLAFILLVYMAMKGFNILFTALVCSLVAALFGGLDLMTSGALEVGLGAYLYESILENYMQGYVTFFKSNFMMFLAGAVFGKLMEESLGADAIATWIIKKLGASKAVLAVVLSCFILAYGGVSVFVVGFTIYPLAVNLFKEANLPRRFLPGTLAFGCVTFAMTSPGTPQIQNMVPANILGTSAMAGTTIGIIAGIFMFVVGMIMLDGMIKKDVAGGGHYVPLADETIEKADEDKLPSPIVSLVPLVLTILLLNAFKFKVEVSIFCGVLVGLVLFNVTSKTVDIKDFPNLFARGGTGAVSAIANTCAVVGFGNVVKTLPAFDSIIEAVTNIPGPALVGAAIAVTVICGICGSASGGLGISIPIVAPIYTALGVAPEALHRVASIASGALDSMPHNGYIVTTLNICKTSHKDGYLPIFWLTVVLPFVACAISIALFQLFPNLP